MKRQFALLLVCAGLGFCQPAVWHLDPAHSSAEFAVRHMGISTVRGAFTKVNGTVTYDPADLSKTAVDVTIDAASVDTRVTMRDNDLRSEHFLDVQKYPEITFKGKGAEEAGPGKLKIPGELTIHGVTKHVVLNVDGPSAPVKDRMGNTHVGASATTTINRSDFGMNMMQGMVGDQVVITIDADLVKGNRHPGMPPGEPRAAGRPGAPGPAGQPPTR